MSIRSVITTQEDFTGEFPVKYAASGLWRFDETEPENVDGEYRLSDSSDKKRYAVIHNCNSPTAALLPGKMGNYFRLNTNDPATEQTYLRIANDGTIFENL